MCLDHPSHDGGDGHTKHVTKGSHMGDKKPKDKNKTKPKSKSEKKAAKEKKKDKKAEKENVPA